MSRRPRAGTAAVALLALSLAACGGGSPKRAGPVEPAETIDGFVNRLETTIETIREGRCDGVSAFNSDAAFALTCDVTAQRAYAGFRVTGTATFGTGGVVDFTDAEVARGGTYVVGLDPKRRFSIVLAAPVGQKTVGTKQRNPAAFNQAAQRFVAAIRNRNCDEYVKYSFAAAGVSRKRACAEAFSRDSGIQPELAGDRRAAPRPLGGNSYFAFYALSSKPDHYRTLVVARVPPARYLVSAIRVR